MEGIKILIILFGILFIIERKPMNIIFNFIGLIVTIAIVLGINNTDYISYLLIIIYCSALTIIFGFVIMLTPAIKKNQFFQDNNILFLFPFIIFITFFIFQDNMEIPTILYNDETLVNNFIYKIGNLLYSEEINIMKFMIATLILLLALVALFFILFPTF